MEKITFKYNWNNKLHCYNFTTLRLSDKYPPGTLVEVVGPGVKPFVGRVVARRILIKPEMNDWICRLDTGYGREETMEILFRMFPSATLKTPFYWHMIERVKETEKVPQPTHESILDLFRQSQPA
jgi:hypothetical protein